jgi:hypothetical protein
MNRISEISGVVRENERHEALHRFSQGPLKWVAKWIVGKVVYLIYLGLLFVLFLWYYYVFLPWKDK